MFKSSAGVDLLTKATAVDRHEASSVLPKEAGGFLSLPTSGTSQPWGVEGV